MFLLHIVQGIALQLKMLDSQLLIGCLDNQEVFLKYFNKLARAESRGSLSAWVPGGDWARIIW
jgi:hypothetical protein